MSFILRGNTFFSLLPNVEFYIFYKNRNELKGDYVERLTVRYTIAEYDARSILI